VARKRSNRALGLDPLEDIAHLMSEKAETEVEVKVEVEADVRPPVEVGPAEIEPEPCQTTAQDEADIARVATDTEVELDETGFTPSPCNGTRYRVAKRVREMVRFGRLNLSDPSSYWIAAQDVIFCQNVLIYFKPESKVEIVGHLCKRLVPGGHLFLAPGEMLSLRLPGVELVHFDDALVFKRVK
jgi:hypothetical protein